MSLMLKRYSPVHLEASASLRGRGLFFSRTPDGVWWALRLRRRECVERGPWDDSDGTGLREPRRPAGPDLSGAVSLDLP